MHHGARDPAQQHAARGDDHRETVHEFEHQLAAPNDDRDADQQAEDDQGHLVVGVARSLGSTGNGDHVVHAHDQVGNDHGFDGAPELVAALDVAVVIVGVGGEQFHTNPDEQNGAHQLEVRNGQQGERKEDQDHAQDDGTGRAPHDALGALVRWQLAASQRDHHRIVATQKDVDHDDLGHGYPERSGHKFFHDIPLTLKRGQRIMISKTKSRIVPQNIRLRYCGKPQPPVSILQFTSAEP